MAMASFCGILICIGFAESCLPSLFIDLRNYAAVSGSLIMAGGERCCRTFMITVRGRAALGIYSRQEKTVGGRRASERLDRRGCAGRWAVARECCRWSAQTAAVVCGRRKGGKQRLLDARAQNSARGPGGQQRRVSVQDGRGVGRDAMWWRLTIMRTIIVCHNLTRHPHP